ncbi:MAG: aminoglycoside 6-adenylyltransferase [Oscillospiraceae bacterium]|nr:aminoglycoside 6-adenylyltransferase [Oscillospiraceae bacterium]
MKGLLLRLMEIHARVKNGMAYDTWWDGRFIDSWAEEQALSELKNAFAHYDPADVLRALRVTMRLFQRLALEIAGALGYAYPHAAEKSAVAWLDLKAGMVN